MLSKVHPVSVKINFILSTIRPDANCFQGVLTKGLILTGEELVRDKVELKF